MNIKTLAKLARLDMTKEEEVTLQLEAVLQHFENLQKISMSTVEPLFNPLDAEPYFRDDDIRTELTHENALCNAPQEIHGGFKVPPVV